MSGRRHSRGIDLRTDFFRIGRGLRGDHGGSLDSLRGILQCDGLPRRVTGAPLADGCFSARPEIEESRHIESHERAEDMELSILHIDVCSSTETSFYFLTTSLPAATHQRTVLLGR